MGDGDKLLCTAGKALSTEMGNAVFGDHIVHIILAGSDNGTLGQAGLDLTDGAALGC